MRCQTLSVLLGVLVLLPGTAAAQSRTIAGRVTDARTGDPVAGGVIQISDLDIQSRLYPDGVFVLHVPIGVVEDLTLVARAPGYRTSTVTVNPRRETVFITLEPDVLELEALVVSGRATTVERRQGATAAETITLDAARRPPASTVPEVLRGQAAGVDVLQNSGAPGADVMVVFRGVSSMRSTTPLYVLDGVPVSDAAIPDGSASVTGGQPPVPSRIADLNPRDIESIEILRGSAATTMYGSKGANGVVIIRTKRGG